MQCFLKEAFGGLGISRRTQEKLQGIAFGIDGTVEIPPGFLDFDVRFIHFPRVVAGFEMWSASFVELGGIVLDPAIDRCVIDGEPRSSIISSTSR